MILKNTIWIRWWDYLDSLIECGPSLQIGTGNIKLFQRMINEIYKAGFKDGGESTKSTRRLPTRRSLRGKRNR